MVQVYVVDARKPGKKTPDKRIPFERFYLVPSTVPFEQMRRITPYAIITRLTESYKDVLEERGVSFDSIQDHWVVVPIHMTQDLSRKGELHPSYVSNRAWLFATHRLPEFFPEDVTLLTPEGPITPICLSCDRHLDHIAGECTIGSDVCADHIRVKFTPVPDLVTLSVPVGA